MSSTNNSSAELAADDQADLVHQIMDLIERRVQVIVAAKVENKLVAIHAKMDYLNTVVDNLVTLINEVGSNPSALQIPEGGTTSQISGDTTPKELHQAKTPSVVPSTPDLLGQPSPFTYNTTPATQGVKVHTRLLASSDMSSPSTSSHITSPAEQQPKPQTLPDLVVVSHHSLPLASSKPPVKSSEASGEQYSDAVEERQQQKSSGNPRSSDSVFNHSIDDYRPLVTPVDDDDNKSVYDSVYEEPITYTAAKSHSDNATGDGGEKENNVVDSADGINKSDNKPVEKNPESPFKISTSPSLPVGQFYDIPPPPPPHASFVTPLNKYGAKEDKAPVVNTKAGDEVKGNDGKSKDAVKEEKVPVVDTKAADEVKSNDDDKADKLLEPFASVVMNESTREPRVINPFDDLSESKLDNSGRKMDESDATEDDEYEAQKSDIVTVKEAESQSTKSEGVLFKNECKLTIFDYDIKQSTELGLGYISIAYNSESGCCQVQMKRHRDEKICADFTIRGTSFLTDKSNTKNCGIVRCEDISDDGTPKSTYFIIRFRELKPYDEFKNIFNEAVQNIQRNNTTEKLVKESEHICIPFKKQYITHDTPIVDSVTPAAAAATSSSGVTFGTPTHPPKNFPGFAKSQKTSAEDAWSVYYI